METEQYDNLSADDKFYREEYIIEINKRLAQEYRASKGEDKLNDLYEIEQFAKERGLGRLVTMSDQGEPMLNVSGEVVAGLYDSKQAWQNDMKERQDFYGHVDDGGEEAGLLDYLAKKSQQPEYSDDAIVSWAEHEVTNGDMQRNIENRGVSCFDHIAYDSLFTGVDEGKKLTDIGKVELSQMLLDPTDEDMIQMDGKRYLTHFKKIVSKFAMDIDKEISDKAKEGRLTNDYLGDARELFDEFDEDSYQPGSYQLNDMGLAAVIQFYMETKPNDSKDGYYLDDFINDYNTKYNNEQKAYWRDIMHREQKYLDEIEKLGEELISGVTTGKVDLGPTGFLFDASVGRLRLKDAAVDAIGRYLSECQMSGKEFSLDDFVKGYNAGLYRS